MSFLRKVLIGHTSNPILPLLWARQDKGNSLVTSEKVARLAGTAPSPNLSVLYPADTLSSRPDCHCGTPSTSPGKARFSQDLQLPCLRLKGSRTQEDRAEERQKPSPEAVTAPLPSLPPAFSLHRTAVPMDAAWDPLAFSSTGW